MVWWTFRVWTSNCAWLIFQIFNSGLTTKWPIPTVFLLDKAMLLIQKCSIWIKIQKFLAEGPERAPENVENEFKRNHFHICLLLRFRRLILVIHVDRLVSLTFDDVINFQWKRLATRLERTILSRSMGNIYSCGPSSKYHFDCNAALTLPMRIKSCGLIKNSNLNYSILTNSGFFSNFKIASRFLKWTPYRFF